MDLYKVAVAVDGRNIEVVLKPGVMATVELGSYENNVETPKNRVNVIVGESKQGPAAWIQVGTFGNGDVIKIIIQHEGWQRDSDVISKVSNPTPEMLNNQGEADFGASACCTSHGNGCYVRCCNCCCSDPTGCPGASCCG